MRLRQEQVVLGLTVVLLGFLATRSDSVGGVRGNSRPRALEAEHFAPPPVDRALPPGTERLRLDRGLFTPPSDTRPLAPLDFVEPPRSPLPVVQPPPAPGPAPRHYAAFLHAHPEVTSVPELFATAERAPSPPPLEAAGEDDDGLLDVSGRARASLESLDEGPPVETAAERAARLEGYKQLYDWVRINDFQYLFGRIENPDRYGLRDPERDDEPVLFVELNPETGAERMPGQSAIAYPRSRVTSFGFADTPTNRVELARRELGEIGPADYLPALALADECIRLRHEVPRGLEVAEELYRALSALDPNDPYPRLGIARCLEAGFRFEEAFEEYRSLLERFDHRAVVHVRLAQLEARFLLDGRAEERLRRAVRLEPALWEPNHALGRFLLERGRGDEALPFLERAATNAPVEPERKATRTRTRYDLAAAQLFTGRLDEARATCRVLLRGDPDDPRGRAAMLAAGVLEPGGARSEGRVDAGGPEGVADAVELLVARGLRRLQAGEWEAARDELLAAVELDPLRAHLGLRALSYLAEVTGHDDRALAFAERAVECAPQDAYSLYQRGRLLAAVDDYEGAVESLTAALARDVEFEDALIALGELAYRRGDFGRAERYLERAVELSPGRADVRVLRGVNRLVRDLVEPARESFLAARERDPANPTAAAGLAWVEYLSGDPEEALIQLANLDERRRALAEDDPWRLWAAAQIERVGDHLGKVAWNDDFERREIRNRWFVEERVGPLVEIEDGAVRLEGVFTTSGRTRLYREYPAGIFVSFEADVRVASGGAARVGIFLAREQERRGETEVLSEASLARHKDGELQSRLLRSGRTENEWRDVPAFSFPSDRWVRLRAERDGDGAESRVTLSLDGVPVVEDESLVGLGRATSALRVGIFAEGETGRRVQVDVDDVEVVFRR